MQGTNEFRSKIGLWREKAKKRSKEISAHKSRIKELIISRDNWKMKYKSSKAKNLELLKELKRVKKAISNDTVKKAKPRNHSYSVQIIMLCIWLRQGSNCSLRGCASILKIMSLMFGLELSCPSYGSIQNWEKKLGYSRLQEVGLEGQDWVLILDESISIGQQKLLLILGIELGKYSFGQALCFEDVQVLYIGIGSSWQGAQISKEIEKLKSKGFSISYAVSDGGTNLGKGLRISSLLQVQDCTHAIGNLLKKQYNKDESFISFSKQCGIFKRQIMLGKDAFMMPPKQRVKGRFLNLEPLSDWAYKMLMLIQNPNSMLSDEQKEKLAWLSTYESLISQIYQECKTMNQLFKILKHQGLSQQSVQKCQLILKSSKATVFFKKGVRQYLKTNLKLMKSKQPIICCSDIIESYFGKYKNQLAKTSAQLITDSCLCIPNFNHNFDEQEIKKAMEKIKIVDLKKWRLNNLPDTLFQQKRKMLKNVG